MHSQDDLGEYTRKFTKFTAILITNQKLSEMEHDIMFLAGFPMPLQDRVCHRLAIIVMDASSIRMYSFLPASWVGDTHEETDILPISEREEGRRATTRPSY